MPIQRLPVATLLFCALTSLPSIMQAANTKQSIRFSNTVQIPGASLPRGDYLFSVEDRLAHRAIVRIENASDPGQHYLLLAVPNSKVTANGPNRTVYFQSDPPALKAWNCGSCVSPLEFAYPKEEAVRITRATSQSVLAVDPASDKLPDNLSPDDMKVVTLWLLSPKSLADGSTGHDVQAARYSSASAEKSTVAGLPPASRSRLPNTAGTNPTFVASGLGCLLLASSIRLWRRRRIV